MAVRNQHAIQPLPHFYLMAPKKVHDEFQFRIGLPERMPTNMEAVQWWWRRTNSAKHRNYALEIETTADPKKRATNTTLCQFILCRVIALLHKRMHKTPSNKTTNNNNNKTYDLESPTWMAKPKINHKKLKKNRKQNIHNNTINYD